MSDVTTTRGFAEPGTSRPRMDAKPHAAGAIGFLLVLVAGLGYAAFSIARDIGAVGEHDIATGRIGVAGPGDADRAGVRVR